MQDQPILNVMRLFRLDGECAFITGAGAGIGRIGALALAEAGAAIAVTDIDLDRASRVVAEIEAAGGRAVAFHLDVADRAEIDEVIGEAVEIFGRLDILINNAGTARRGPTEKLDDADWDAAVAINMTAAFLCARAAGRHMIRAGKGRIINIASIMGLVASNLYPHIAYFATKGALVNMTRALAVEWAPKGIRVNAIAPTFVKTDFIRAVRANPEIVRRIEEATPIGRFAEPEEIAGGILYLASAASSMVTGHVLAIDGGWLAM